MNVGWRNIDWRNVGWKNIVWSKIGWRNIGWRNVGLRNIGKNLHHKGDDTFQLQTVPLETKDYWSGSAAIKKRCKAPRGRWKYTNAFDTFALAIILSSIVSGNIFIFCHNCANNF